jgi:hypothetical protein
MLLSTINPLVSGEKIVILGSIFPDFLSAETNRRTEAKVQFTAYLSFKQDKSKTNDGKEGRIRK